MGRVLTQKDLELIAPIPNLITQDYIDRNIVRLQTNLREVWNQIRDLDSQRGDAAFHSEKMTQLCESQERYRRQLAVFNQLNWMPWSSIQDLMAPVQIAKLNNDLKGSLKCTK